MILQLEEPPEKIIALENIFPAFKLSLSNHTRWPGILLWNMAGDSIFLELSKEKKLILERLTWTYRELAKSIGIPNLKSLEKKFNDYFILSSTDETVRILHLSDLHLGSSISNKRLPRIYSLIESQLSEFGDETPIIPVISGDLMDSPNKENLSNFRLFEGFLNSKGFKQPVIVLGNHDVRKDGWLWSLFKTSVNISTQPVYWFDEYKIGFICFNSVNAGYLARGFIGEEEFLHIGNVLDKEKTKSKEYTLIGVLHHHPIPVEIPDWYRKSWYERIFGNKFEKSEELEDSIPFLAWIKARNIKIILHGHKHIPRVDIHDDINIIGCGSSTGKIDSSETGETFISMNLITIDRNRKSISCRLKAERIPGGGINSVSSHELAISREIY
ncbi:metallophosphoesterase [Leptospira biflexa]|uniref:metallophosphoesterase family protein n=1 Tax=Leptospira biflexa TaxID=172 RepID=UPI001090C785|nr:metallophosphoesterase [Leptospira biflexa]TGM41703.1 metallophosphoesterase [Leptospira biflexa]TGM43884.1 metallophosphoesterase [Leptospira biflexa]